MKSPNWKGNVKEAKASAAKNSHRLWFCCIFWYWKITTNGRKCTANYKRRTAIVVCFASAFRRSADQVVTVVGFVSFFVGRCVLFCILLTHQEIGLKCEPEITQVGLANQRTRHVINFIEFNMPFLRIKCLWLIFSLVRIAFACLGGMLHTHVLD